jgi:hypothetical protein
MKNFIRYNRYFFSLFFGLSLTIVVLCYYIDPYAFYGHVYDKDGKAVNGYEFTSQQRMVKPLEVIRYRPEILMLGSSRTALGFSAQSLQHYFPNQRIYNLSLLGVIEYEILRYFQHASAVSDLKHVIIGLDFLQFKANQGMRPDFVEERLAVDVNNQPYKKPYLGDYLSTLFSMDAAIGVFKQITGLVKKHDLYYTNGFRVQAIDGGGLLYFTRNEGGYINGTYADFQMRSGTIDTLAYYRQILELAQQKHIPLHLFISPSHARQWEALHGSGLWQMWEDWKRQLVIINEEVAKQYHVQPFELYDFSGYSRFSTEAVPREPEKIMRWYSDASHFLPEVGEFVLKRMFSPSAKDEPGFGVLLTPATIENNLATLRAGRLQYIRTHPLDKADIDNLVQERAHRLAQ